LPYFETIENNTVYYESFGKSGPIVILLHGLGSSSKIWVHQIRFLQKSYRVFVLDFPGHGRSGWHYGYSFEQEVDVIYQLMTHCQIPKATLIAVSMGCTPALLFSASYPNKVNRLILEGPIGGYSPWWEPIGLLDFIVFTFAPIMIELSIALKGYHQTAHWINQFGLKKMTRLKRLEGSQDRTDYLAIRQLFWGSACAPYAKVLDCIECPVLLIRGTSDPFPKRFSEYIVKHLKNVSFVEVEKTRHVVSLEKPNYFNSLASVFLVDKVNCKLSKSDSQSLQILPSPSIPSSIS